jgi:4-hydroxybenzoate polyprenyltransferase
MTAFSAADQTDPPPTETRSLPLVVDLDGTLIANDILWETASQFLSHHPTRVGRMLGWFRRGKAFAKRRLWEATDLDVTTLNYHAVMIEWLRAERAGGRTLVLASAADNQALSAINEHLDLFDVLIGSDGSTNLRSESKAEALTRLYGEGGFEYVGNSDHDMAVWRRSAVAHVATANRSIEKKARGVAEVGRTFPPVAPPSNPWVKAMRPHQWVKNFLIFIPLFSAQRAGDPAAVLDAVLAFVAFSLAASSVYLLNDLADVRNDRLHPTKRWRPFAAGTLSLLHGWLAWPLLSVASLLIGFQLVGPLFGVVLVLYLIATTAYSFSLKRRPIVDILTLAGLYTVRLVAGAAAISVELSLWLLSFSGFFFLSLALVKRVSELSRVRATGGVLSGRGYQLQDLELLSSYGVSTSIASVLVFTLFIYDTDTAALYTTPALLWASVPVLLWWIMRVWLKAHRGQMNEDPIVFAIRDPLSVLCGGLMAAVFVAATFIDASHLI